MKVGNMGVLAACVLAAGGCGGTSTGNGIVQIDYQAFNQLAWYENLFVTPAYATVSSVTFCFKRVRFKTANVGSTDPTNDSDNQDFPIGEVTLSPSGGTLGSLTLPYATYQRIEFDLEDHCASGNSVSVSNSNPGGPFTTNSRVTVKFEGSFTVDQSSETVRLGLQNMITALDSVVTGSDIKTSLEAVSGDM